MDKKEIERKRDDGVPCANKACEFFELMSLDGSGCDGESKGEAAIATCKKYIPCAD
jgi:hypothetical protein